MAGSNVTASLEAIQAQINAFRTETNAQLAELSTKIKARGTALRPTIEAQGAELGARIEANAAAIKSQRAEQKALRGEPSPRLSGTTRSHGPWPGFWQLPYLGCWPRSSSVRIRRLPCSRRPSSFSDTRKLQLSDQLRSARTLRRVRHRQIRLAAASGRLEAVPNRIARPLSTHQPGGISCLPAGAPCTTGLAA